MDKLTYIQLDRIEAKIDALLEANGIKTEGNTNDPNTKN
jgi:hypothetical protein